MQPVHAEMDMLNKESGKERHTIGR